MDIKQLFLIIALLCLGVVTYLFSDRSSLLDLVLLMIGAFGVRHDKVVRLHTVCAGIFLAITFLCSVSGIIIDYLTYRTLNGVRISDLPRHSFGIGYATDFAAHVFFLYISHYFLRSNRKLGIIDIALAILIVLLLNHYCDARVSEISILLAMVLFYLSGRESKFFSWRIVNFGIRWAYPVCAAFAIGTAYIYKSSSTFWIRLDDILFSKRLTISHKVMMEQGFSLFGRNIEMQGLGFNVEGFDKSIGTTYLDSAYIQLIMLYGVVATVFSLILLFFFSKKVIATGDTQNKVIIIVVAISCILNQYLLDIAYNPFILITLDYVVRKHKRRLPSG